MATSRERNLRLNITGDVSDVNASFKLVRAEAKALGVDVAKVTTTLTDTGKKISAVYTGTAEDLRKFNTEAKKIGSTTDTNNLEAQAAAKKRVRAKEKAERLAHQRERVNSFKSSSAELIRTANLEANALGTVAAKGTNHRLSIKKTNAVKLKALERKLQKELTTLASKFGKGNGRSISGQRSAILAAYKKETAEIHKQNAALDVTAQKTRNVLDPHKSWIRHVTEIVGIYRLVNFGINTIIQSIKSIPAIGIEFQTTKAVLESTLGSTTAVTGAFTALEKEADRTGISITNIRENFRNLNASMSLAGETTDVVFKVFTDLNTVSTALHLSGEKTQAVFLAIAQIFNKTKVQSEELVKQLGNLLPGAFASFAAATGRSTKELAKQMQLGLITAHDDVVAFTDFMAKRFAAGFGLAEAGLQANIGRMKTSFVLLGEAIFKTTEGPMSSFTQAATSVAESLTVVVGKLEEFSNIIGSVAVFGVATLVTSLLNTLVPAIKTAVLAAGSLRAALLFIINPATIIAGAAAVAFAISRIGAKSRDVREDLQGMINDISSITKAKEIDPIEIRIDQTATIQRADELLTKLAGQIVAANNEIKRLEKEPLSADRTVALKKAKLAEKQLSDLLNEGFKARQKFRDLERSKIEIEAKRQQDALDAIGKGADVVSKTGGSKAETKAQQATRLRAEAAYQTMLQKTFIERERLNGFEQAAAQDLIALQSQLALAKITGNTQIENDARKALADIEARKLATLALTFQEKERAKVSAQLAISESLIQAQASAGIIDQVSAFDRIQEKRKESLETMEQLIAANEAWAASSGPASEAQTKAFADAKQSAELLRLKILSASKEQEERVIFMGENIRDSLDSSLGNAFHQFATGAKSASDAMAQFAADILSNVAKIAANQLATELIGFAVSSIGGLISSTASAPAYGSGVSGGNSAGFSSLIDNAFRAKDGTTAKGLSSASGTVLNTATFFPNATALASGGVVAGEAGAEVVLPLERGDNGKLGVSAEGVTTGGNTYNISVSVESSKNDTPEDTGFKVATALMKKVAQSEIANANRKANQSNKITSFS